MNNLKIYCLCIHDELLDKVEKLGYLPVGLGQNNYKKGWIRDDIGKNISHKNKYYGEYTFHYWLWQNKMTVSLCSVLMYVQKKTSRRLPLT